MGGHPRNSEPGGGGDTYPPSPPVAMPMFKPATRRGNLALRHFVSHRCPIGVTFGARGGCVLVISGSEGGVSAPCTPSYPFPPLPCPWARYWLWPAARKEDVLAPKYAARGAIFVWAVCIRVQVKLLLLGGAWGLNFGENEHRHFVTTCSEQEKILRTPCSLKIMLLAIKPIVRYLRENLAQRFALRS